MVGRGQNPNSKKNLIPMKDLDPEKRKEMNSKGGKTVTDKQRLSQRLRQLREKGLDDSGAKLLYELMTSPLVSSLDILLNLRKIQTDKKNPLSVKEKLLLNKTLVDWHKINHGSKLFVEQTEKHIQKIEVEVIHTNSPKDEVDEIGENVHKGTIIDVEIKERLLITGYPKAGKTTMTESMEGTILHTDDLMAEHKWSAVSQYVADNWFNDKYDVIEGVAIPRALRKWLKANPEGKPCDKIIFLTKPHIELNTRQIGMGKGVLKVFNELEIELIKRGVDIEIDGVKCTSGD